MMTPPGLQGRQRPLAELRTSGMLWLINRIVFHPRGLALSLHLDDAGAVIGWSIVRAFHNEPFAFTESDDNTGFQNASHFLGGL